MEKLTCPQRLARLKQFVDEGRIIRSKWKGRDAAGRETACLLAALSPEVAASENSSSCPADVMPAWLAYLTPSIDDNGTAGHWPAVVKRFASLAHRACGLSAERWTRLDFEVRAIAVREGRGHVTEGAVLKVIKVIDGVLALLDRAAGGGVVTDQEWSAARSAARSAAYSAAESAAWSAAESAAWSAASAAYSEAYSAASAVYSAADSAADSAAESAADSAAYSAASAARSAARIAADSAAYSAARSAAGSAAYSAARSAAYSAAWDRMIDKWFDVIERAIVEMESAK